MDRAHRRSTPHNDNSQLHPLAQSAWLYWKVRFNSRLLQEFLQLAPSIPTEQFAYRVAPCLLRPDCVAWNGRARAVLSYFELELIGPAGRRAPARGASVMAVRAQSLCTARCHECPRAAKILARVGCRLSEAHLNFYYCSPPPRRRVGHRSSNLVHDLAYGRRAGS